ncbi:MAG: HAD hydrolase family protein, partial [Clostridia bacterium]|nr:HAD hydrolase family protein [Clostridia bacterium]
MKYKMICSDLDDTMITRDQKYGKGEKDAIKRYVDAGGKFVIVTGRMTSGVLPVCRDLDLHGEVL